MKQLSNTGMKTVAIQLHEPQRQRGVKDKAMVKEQRANRCRQRAMGVTDTVATVLLISSKVRKSHVL